MSAESDDRDWVENTIRALRLVEPRIGCGALEARRARARLLVAEVPPSRRPALVVALFDLYDACKGDGFLELMYLVEALYGALPEISEEQACAILAATRHSCGHGGIEEPIDLASSAFADRPYTPLFFDALRTYRDRLSHIRSAAVTRARGRIAMLLWQDAAEPLHRVTACRKAYVRATYPFRTSVADRGHGCFGTWTARHSGVPTGRGSRQQCRCLGISAMSGSRNIYKSG